MALPISSISLSNTFGQWVLVTQNIVTELNALDAKIKSGTLTKDTGTFFINTSGIGLAVANTATFGSIQATGTSQFSGNVVFTKPIVVNTASSSYISGVELKENNLVFSTVTPSSDSHISVNRGNGNTNAQIRWQESVKKWQTRNVDSPSSYYNIITTNETATTSNVGIVRLNDTLTNTSTTLAATANSVNAVSLLVTALSPAITNAYNTANSAYNTANSAYNQANSAYNTANTANTRTSFTDINYTGTLVGSNGVINIGNGQVYKAASGNVGIGITNPSRPLHVSASSTNAVELFPVVRITANTTATADYFGPGIEFEGEKFDGVLATLGKIGFQGWEDNGNATSDCVFEFSVNGSALQKLVTFAPSVGDTADDMEIGLRLKAYTSNGDSTSYIYLQHTRGTEAAKTNLQLNDGLGELSFQGYNNGDYRTGARISAFVSSATSNGTMPSSLLFYTMGASAVSPTERMRITSDGEIQATGDIVAYVSSDINLKENIINIQNPIEKIKQINGVSFEWNDDYLEKRGGIDEKFVRKQDIGVIAQEIEKVLPDIVVLREDGYKAVKYEKIIPLLIECIKEQQNQIEKLSKIIELK